MMMKLLCLSMSKYNKFFSLKNRQFFKNLRKKENFFEQTPKPIVKILTGYY